jgi:hypothetical protein
VVVVVVELVLALVPGLVVLALLVPVLTGSVVRESCRHPPLLVDGPEASRHGPLVPTSP